MPWIPRLLVLLGSALLLGAVFFGVASWSRPGSLALSALILRSAAVLVGCAVAAAAVLLTRRGTDDPLHEAPAGTTAIGVLSLAIATLAGTVLIWESAGIRTPLVDDRLLLGLLATAVVTTGAAVARLSVTFPRSLDSDAFEDRRRAWNGLPSEQRRRRIQGLTRMLERKHDEALIRPLSSWLGLPWSAWRWTAVLAPSLWIGVVLLPGAAVLLAATFTFVVLATHGVIYFMACYAMLADDDRHRLRWLTVAVFLPCMLPGIAFALSLTLSATGTLLNVLGLPVATAAALATAATVATRILVDAIPLVVVLGLAMAVFWDGALDPRLVVRETIIYGILSGFLMILFTGVESVLSEAIAVRLHFLDRGAGWIAGVVVALLFNPARNRLERILGARPTEQAPRSDASNRTAERDAQPRV